MEEQRKEAPMEAVQEIAWQLMEKLERAVQELDCATTTVRARAKTEDGEEITEYQKRTRKKTTVDRGGLKQLTGVLGDLMDILLAAPELDRQEKEARIAKLMRDLQQQTAAPEITVKLEGELEEYAG